MGTIPTGTVTFLFTDIEGSTKLAREHPETWEDSQAQHYAILREAVESNGGYVFQTIGDAVCAAFHNAGDALQAAIRGQQDLQNKEWGMSTIRVRMGIHSGQAEFKENNYHGYLALSLVQRVMSAGHGGQVLLSGATEYLMRGQIPEGIELVDEGRHTFKDVPQAVRVFQVVTPSLSEDFPPLRTFDILPNNLPAQLTSFVGREKELGDVIRLLRNTHLLTLIGPGGTGKTRLSLQVANNVLAQYPDGVWLVDLAPIVDPQLVPRTTAITIGLRDEPQRPSIDMLCDYLSKKKMLILLDNCEHLVDACAQLVDQILHIAVDVRILASSRETLGIDGEITYRVPSLGLPDVDNLPPLEVLSQYEAVRLFIDRAMSAIPDFKITNDNAPALVQVCHRLDGIPLAIELAAAKMRLLSMEQIAKRLDDRFRLLTGGSRTALERHQTLRAAVDWSYNLLPPEEQILFRRLAVFIGGWTLEAAESVCGVVVGSGDVRSEDVLDLLEQLINKSLVVKEEEYGKSRFYMLETMRQYANEKWIESGESDALRNRHLEYFVKLAETAEPHLRSARQIEWVNHIDAEHENLRAALEWAIHLPSAELALRLAGALGEFWHLRAYWLEGAKWLDLALSREWDCFNQTEIFARMKTLYQRAELAEDLDELELLKTSAQGALALCEEVGDTWGIAYSHALVALHLKRIGNYKEARGLFDCSLAEFQSLDDAWGESLVLDWMDWVIVNMGGEPEEYFENQRHMVDRAHVSGAPERIAASLFTIAGHFFDGHSQWEQAEKELLEAEEIYTMLNSSVGINRVREFRARMLFVRGDFENAKAAYDLTLDHYRRVGNKFMQGHSSLYLCLIAEAERDFDQAVEYGRQAAKIIGELGNSAQQAICLYALGWSEYQQGNIRSAIQTVVNALVALKQGGEIVRIDFDNQYFLSLLSGFFVEEQTHVSVKLLALYRTISQEFDYPRYSLLHELYFDRFLKLARTKLSEADFTCAWDAGLKITLEDAVELGLKALEEMRNE